MDCAITAGSRIARDAVFQKKKRPKLPHRAPRGPAPTGAPPARHVAAPRTYSVGVVPPSLLRDTLR